MSWVVYILECSDSQRSLYTGITNDLPKRIAIHNSGKGSKYVRSRLPAILFKSFPAPNKSQALKLEYYIKTLSHDQKLAFDPNLPPP